MNLNNKGFTLIELIATIALLSIIAIISFVSINGVINQSKVNDCESLVSNIKSAVKEYVSDKRYSLSNRNDLNINVETLINGKYLSNSIINPFKNKEITPNNIKINITLKDDYSVDTIFIYKNNVSDANKYTCDIVDDSDKYSCNKNWWDF